MLFNGSGDVTHMYIVHICMSWRAVEVFIFFISFHHTSTLPLRVSVTMLVDYLTRTLKKYKNYSKLPTTIERIWR